MKRENKSNNNSNNDNNNDNNNNNAVNMEDLITRFKSTAVAPGVVQETAPSRVLRFHQRGSLKEPSTRKQKFKLANPIFKPSHLHSVPVEYRRFPRINLLHTNHTTAKLRAVNIRRRRGLGLGLKKKTVRKPAQAPAKRSTRRKSTK